MPRLQKNEETLAGNRASSRATQPIRTANAVNYRGFSRLVAGAAIVTFLMITIGAITRVSESGMGCGVYWPTCNGKIIPEFENVTVVIEFGHRLFALLVGAFALAVTIQAWRFFGPAKGLSFERIKEPRLFWPSVLGFILYFVQSGLGAITVHFSNQWLTVLVHLANSMILLACYLVAWTYSTQQIDRPAEKRDLIPTAEVILAAALSLIVALIGAAVAGNIATKACVGWPLCAGQVWPAEQGPLQMLNMLHRLVVGGLGIILILMLIQTRGEANRPLRRALIFAFSIFLLQAALGAMVVLVNNREWLVTARALHVTFAAATWSAIVIASAIAWLQQSPNRRMQKASAPSGQSIRTTQTA